VNAHYDRPQSRRLAAAEHGLQKQQVDADALHLVEQLTDAGYQGLLVGGCVRDLLLGVTPKDFDVATNATPEEVKRLFRRSRLVGRRFRIAHVRYGRKVIEVSTFRKSPDLNNDFFKSDGLLIIREYLRHRGDAETRRIVLIRTQVAEIGYNAVIRQAECIRQVAQRCIVHAVRQRTGAAVRPVPYIEPRGVRQPVRWLAPQDRQLNPVLSFNEAHRASPGDLFLEDRHHAALAGQHIAEAHGCEPRLRRSRQRLDVYLG